MITKVMMSTQIKDPVLPPSIPAIGRGFGGLIGTTVTPIMAGTDQDPAKYGEEGYRLWQENRHNDPFNR